MKAGLCPVFSGQQYEMLRLQLLAGQCRCLVCAGFQFQVTDQTDTALGMQDTVDVPDGSKNDPEVSLDIGAGGMGFQCNFIVPEQFYDPGNLFSYGYAASERDDL